MGKRKRTRILKKERRKRSVQHENVVALKRIVIERIIRGELELMEDRETSPCLK